MRAPSFVVWFTGIPASGKSTIAAAVVRRLAELGTDVVVLESDQLRRIYQNEDNDAYSDAGREEFYATVGRLARLVCGAGVPVLVDATANRRRYRDAVRSDVERFAEIFVDAPVAVARQRDPKGLYARAAGGAAGGTVEGTVERLPGLSAVYEPPLRPDLTVRSAEESAESAAERIVEYLLARGWLRRDAQPPGASANRQTSQDH